MKFRNLLLFASIGVALASCNEAQSDSKNRLQFHIDSIQSQNGKVIDSLNRTVYDLSIEIENLKGRNDSLNAAIDALSGSEKKEGGNQDNISKVLTEPTGIPDAVSPEKMKK